MTNKLEFKILFKKKKIEFKKVTFHLRKVHDFFGELRSRGVNVRPNPRTRQEFDTGFFGLRLGLNGFGS